MKKIFLLFSTLYLFAFFSKATTIYRTDPTGNSKITSIESTSYNHTSKLNFHFKKSVITEDNDLDGGVISEDQTICYNGTLDGFTGDAATGGVGTYNYQWQYSIDGSTWIDIDDATDESYQYNGTLTQTVYVRRRVRDVEFNDAYSNTITIIVYDELDPGTIKSGSYEINYGSEPDDCISGTRASGGTGSIYYQWQSSEDGSSWSDIDGATNYLEYCPGTLTSSTYYRRAVTDDACGPVYSDTFYIKVYEELNGGEISDDQEICIGSTPEILTTDSQPSGGSGDYDYYVWQSSVDGKSWGTISWTESDSYQPEQLTETTYYRKKVYDSNSGTVEYSNVVTITVYDELNGGELSSSQDVCDGLDPDVITGTSASGGTGDYTYQWQQSTDGSLWDDIDDATSESYLPSKDSILIYYRRVVSDNGCEVTAYSDTVYVKVLEELVGGKIVDDQTICFGSVPETLTTSTTATGGKGEYEYKWQYSYDTQTWTNVDDSTAINNYYQPGELTETTYYRKVTTDYCGNIYSDTVTINVYNELIPGTLSSSQFVCSGSEPDTLTGTSPSGGNGDYNYQWQQSIDGSSWTDIKDATDESYYPLQDSTFTYYRRGVIDNTCGNTAYTDSVYIELGEELNAGFISSSQTICYESLPDTLTGTSASGGSGYYTYQWLQSTDGLNWNIIEDAISEIYSPSELTSSTYYRRAVTDDLCGITEYSDSVYIRVKNKLNGGKIVDDQTICFASVPEKIKTSISTTGGKGSYTYKWQYSYDTQNWSYVEDTTAIQTYYQPEELTETTYFRKETTDICGETYSDTVTINVYDELSAGSTSSSQSVCYESVPDTITGTSATGGSGDYFYQWQQSLDGLSWNDIEDATTISYYPSNDSTFSYYRRRVTDSICGTSIYSDSLYIAFYDSLSAGTIVSSQEICYKTTPDSLTGTSATGGSGDYIYQWQQSSDGSSWNDIDDAETENYSPSRLVTSTYYRRGVTDNICGTTVFSDSVYIKVYEKLEGGVIVNDQTVCYGYAPETLMTLNLASGGEEEYEYQWQYSFDNVTWTDIEDAQDYVYQPGEVTETTYFRIETNDECGIVTSNSVTISVEDEFTPGTIGTDQNVCENCSIAAIKTIEEPSTSSGLEYQWQQSTDGSSWEDINGETGDSLYITDLDSTTYFRKKVSTDCGEGYTDTVTVTIYSVLLPGTISSDQEIVSGSEPEEFVGTTASGGSGDYLYQWQFSYNEEDWYTIPEETEMNYQPDSLYQTTYFRRQVSEKNCTTVFSNTITITVSDSDSDEYVLDAGTIGSSQIICYNTVPDKLTGTSASGLMSTYKYYWESSLDSTSWSEIDGENDESYQPENITELTYFRRKAESDSLTAYSNTIYVNTYGQVEVPSLSSDDSYCLGDEITLEVNTSDTVLWYNSDKEMIQQSESYTFTADTSAQYYYTIIDTSGCYGELTLADVTINYANVNITTSYDDIENVTNGDNVVFYPNIDSNVDESEIDYTWTFTHNEKGWYETLYDMEPEEYFHWEGWYSVELDVDLPTGCQYIYNKNNYMYVLEEVDDDATKSNNIDRDKLSADFGAQDSSLVNVTIYPNPVGDVLYIKVQNNKETLPVKIFNSIGSLIYQDTIEENEFLKTVNTSGLKTGLYYITIGSTNYKITKQ